MTRIYAPVTEGSGVQVVHEGLASLVPDYDIRLVNPWQALLPHTLVRPCDSYDVAHSLPDLAGYGISPDVPLVLTFHGFYLDAEALQLANRKQRLFYRGLLAPYVRRALARATAVTAVSAYTASLVFEALNLRPDVISNGVDTERFKPPINREHDGRIRVLFAGNLRNQKGIDMVVAMAKELDDVCEFIVISGLRRHESSLSIENAKLLGRIPSDQMHDVYAKADVLLLPTLREGMSLVTLEAMATGLPVVTTDIQPQRELIEVDEGGLLCPPGDKAAFASALRRLADSPGQRETMGMFNRARVLEKYRLAQMASQYRQLFDSVKRN